jgi:hypothetical protein
MKKSRYTLIRGDYLKHFLVRLMVALAAFGTLSRVHAVLIGLSTPRTGTHSWAGIAAEEGAEMPVADLNAKGGVLGEPIEFKERLTRRATCNTFRHSFATSATANPTLTIAALALGTAAAIHRQMQRGA